MIFIQDQRLKKPGERGPAQILDRGPRTYRGD